MPLIHADFSPVIVIHRNTLLNAALSPTSRLLYAVLLASLGNEEMGIKQVAALVGVQDSETLESHIQELAGAGLVQSRKHAGRGNILEVHEVPLAPEQRAHACVPCGDCGECSCEYMKGVCRGCHSIRQTYAQAEADVARWKAQLEAGAKYAIGQHASRLHRWNCHTLNTPEKSMEFLEKQKPHAKKGGLHWARLPDLFTAEELRLKGTKKRHCALCGPDPL